MEQNKIINSDISINQHVCRDSDDHLKRTQSRLFGFVKNLFCKGLGIILPIWMFFSGAAHATVYLKNVGNETLYVMELTYNIYSRKWHRDGWYKISPGRKRSIDEGCCDNAVMRWNKSHEYYIIISNKAGKILKYNLSKAGRKVCINPKKNYDEHIDLSDTVGMFDRITWPAKYSKCAKGEVSTKWIYNIQDRANLQKTITISAD